MSTVYKYRVRCITDNKYEYVWKETPPTACPVNTGHVIDPSQLVIVEVNKPDIVTIKEENIPTGGHFSTRTIKINAAANLLTAQTLVFPHPVSLLSMSFTSEAQHTGDLLSIMPGGKENIIGATVSPVAVSLAWTASNYTLGATTTYMGKTYTCVANTISNEPPTNSTYWRRGIKLAVSQTVIDNTAIGYYIALDDGTTEQLGEVLSVDAALNTIQVDGAPSRTFAAATYIKQTIYLMKDFELGPAWNVILGESKIGGSYIPADIPILIEYNNKTASTKTLVGFVEYLY